MTELLKNEHYKISRIELAAGTLMPRHSATSDAYIIVESGNALLIFRGEKYELISGSAMSIPAQEVHILKVISDFKALLVLSNGAIINYQDEFRLKS